MWHIRFSLLNGVVVAKLYLGGRMVVGVSMTEFQRAAMADAFGPVFAQWRTIAADDGVPAKRRRAKVSQAASGDGS